MNAIRYLRMALVMAHENAGTADSPPGISCRS
jgi:hypothetical protein